MSERYRRPRNEQAKQRRPSARRRAVAGSRSGREPELMDVVAAALAADDPFPLLSMASTLLSAFRDRPSLGRSREPSLPPRDQVLQTFFDVPLAETSVLLAAVAGLAGDETLRHQVRREVGRRAHALPRWLLALDEAEPVDGVYEMRHVLGDGENLVVGVRLPGGSEPCAAVYVDHNLGTLVRDAYVVPGSLPDLVELVRTTADDPDTTLTVLDPADARARITEAIELGAITVPPLETDTWPACRPLVEWAVGLLPAGGTSYVRPEWTDADREALADRFLASPIGAELHDVDRRSLLESLLWFGTDCGSGDPLRWSPVAVGSPGRLSRPRRTRLTAALSRPRSPCGPGKPGRIEDQRSSSVPSCVVGTLRRRPVASRRGDVLVGRLRVGLVCGHFDPTRDGVADYTRHLARHLRSAGCESLVCTAHRYTDAPADGVVGVTDDWDARGVLRAARALVRLSLDVVHVQFAPSAFGFSRAVGLMPFLVPSGTPVLATLHEFGVWTAHSGGQRLRSAAWSAVERRSCLDRETLGLATRARRVLVTSPEHVDVVAARFPGRDLDVGYLPIAANIPAVPSDRAEPPRAFLSSLGLPVDTCLVVFFGFLHPVKGLERLIEAVATVRPAHPSLRLVLIGGEESHSVSREAAGAMRRRLEDVAHHHGIGDCVLFTGYLPEDDVSGLLRAADAAVFPFDAGVTAKSGSLLAALGHGVPTIATAPPGEVDRVTEVDGVLRVPPRDTAALADALHMVLSDRGLAARLAGAGHGCATRWTWPRIAGIHAQMYAEVLRDAGNVDASIRGGRPHRQGQERR